MMKKRTSDFIDIFRSDVTWKKFLAKAAEEIPTEGTLEAVYEKGEADETIHLRKVEDAWGAVLAKLKGGGEVKKKPRSSPATQADMRLKSGEIEGTIDATIKAVALRGWEDRSLDFDDFAVLRQNATFRNALITGLYEEYFPPGRHEFEFAVLTDIINGLCTFHPASIFAATAVGLVSDAAFDYLKGRFRSAVKSFRRHLGKKYAKRVECFSQGISDLERLETFFRQASNFRARTPKIQKETGIPARRIEELLHAVGYRRYRRGRLSGYWEKPQSQDR